MRPNGVILDVHPEPQNSLVEVWLDGRIHSLGTLDETRTTNKVLAARRARAAVIEQGLFAIEAETTFEFRYYFDSFAEWVAHLEEKGWGDPVSDAPLIARVQDVLRHKQGQIIIREPIYAARLRRLSPMS